VRPLRIIFPAAIFLTLLVVLLIVAACGGEEATTTTQAVPTTEAATTTTQASVSASGLTPVVGTFFLVEEKYTTDGTMVGDVRQIRGEDWVHRYEMSDLRLSGEQESIINVDVRADGSADIWGTAVIRNDGGTWECPQWTGTIARGGLEHYIWAVYTGTGAYAGLTYYEQVHFVEISGVSRPPEEGVAVSGWIQQTE
jgi:hypothetical protein